MSKKILILSGSPRRNGNSDTLCIEFMKGALDAGHEVGKINVAQKNIAPCRGCYFCARHNGKCVQNDDMAEVLEKMIEADVLVLASPVYFYSISAQLKAVIDRTVARWLEIKDKDMYFIASMAEDNAEPAAPAIACFRGYMDCVEGAVEKGILIGTGLEEFGQVKETEFMRQAYEMGKNV